MKVKYIIAMACLGLILNACGKSSSDNNTPQIKTQDEGDLSNSCIVGQSSQSQACQTADSQASNAGFGEFNNNAQPSYWGNNGSGYQSQNSGYQAQDNGYQGQNSGGGYQDNGFAGAEGLCGCDNGYQPTYVYSDGYGVMKCIRETSQTTSQGVLHFSYDVRSKKKRNGEREIQDDMQVSFDFMEVSTNDRSVTTPSGNNCYQSGPVSCVYSQTYNSCGGMKGANGYPVSANCVPNGNSNQGYCVKQSF